MKQLDPQGNPFIAFSVGAQLSGIDNYRSGTNMSFSAKDCFVPFSLCQYRFEMPYSRYKVVLVKFPIDSIGKK